MGESVANIRGGMENVGSDNQVIVMIGESLGCWVLFNVKGLIGDEGIVGEFFFGFGEK